MTPTANTPISAQQQPRHQAPVPSPTGRYARVCRSSVQTGLCKGLRHFFRQDSFSALELVEAGDYEGGGRGESTRAVTCVTSEIAAKIAAASQTAR